MGEEFGRRREEMGNREEPDGMAGSGGFVFFVFSSFGIVSGDAEAPGSEESW